MKVLIIYHSEHHGNTEKIAKAMAESQNATILKAKDMDPKNLNSYDIIGFGSGVYNGRLHKELFTILDRADLKSKKKAFIFSTAGSTNYCRVAHDNLKPELEKKGFDILGEFSCPGFDTALTEEGINKGRPNQDDINNAVEFIKEILQ